MSLLTKLLRKNISAGQTAGYAVATLVGMTIILVALQFYRDITGGGDRANDPFISEDYIIISKPVRGLGSMIGGAVNFSDGEIADLKAQPWVAAAAPFTAAAFDVFGSIELGGSRVSTSMFLESIPDDFFDIEPHGWDYDPERGGEVPVIISKDYLTLYNFGYAPSRGLPQISEAMVTAIPLHLSLSGNGRQETVTARIVGFSSRLNTIAVPQSFMNAANNAFATEEQQPSRLIIRLKQQGDPAATKYLESHRYEVAGDRGNSDRTVFILRMITSVVIGIGAVIAVLAFFILVLSLWLVLQKNREKIRGLVELGYTPGQIAVPYCRLVLLTNFLVFLAAVGITAGAHFVWCARLEPFGLAAASLWTMGLTGVALAVVITLLHVAMIRRKISREAC